MNFAMVLLHLKAIVTLVWLNRSVIFRMCGKVKVKVAHFVLFSVLVGGVVCFILCCIWCFSLWRRVVGNLLFLVMWRMVCQPLCSLSLLRGMLNILSM